MARYTDSKYYALVCKIHLLKKCLAIKKNSTYVAIHCYSELSNKNGVFLIVFEKTFPTYKNEKKSQTPRFCTYINGNNVPTPRLF